MYKTKLEAFEKSIRDFCDEYLVKHPPMLRDSIEYSLLSGGKRLRPLMFLECYKMFGGVRTDYVSKIACAIECIHISSLMHDDLPCLDDDDMRRGKPSNHIKYGEHIALLGGDALLNLAYEALFDAIRESEGNPLVIKAAGVIAKGAGGNGMMGGQVVDLLLQKSGKTPKNPAREVDYIYRNKTGALFVLSLKAGAIMAGLSGVDLDKVASFGMDFGISFQLLDDYQDIQELPKDAKINPMDNPYFAYIGLESGLKTMETGIAAITQYLADLKLRFDTTFFEDMIMTTFSL